MLQVQRVTKEFEQTNGSQLRVLDGVSFDVADGDVVAIVGASGCGKTTLLRMLAGLESIDRGVVSFDNNQIDGPDVSRGIVFQDFALFPWLTVRENVAFGLKEKNDQLVDHYLQVIGLVDFADAYPKQLSGGQKQRVAIARTLAANPNLVCMDEPFGALDVMTRSKMQEFLAALLEKEKKTVVFVTHDIEEALFLADRVLVFGREGLKDIAVPFVRPRQHELKFDTDFVRLRERVSSCLEV